MCFRRKGETGLRGRAFGPTSKGKTIGSRFAASDLHKHKTRLAWKKIGFTVKNEKGKGGASSKLYGWVDYWALGGGAITSPP